MLAWQVWTPYFSWLSSDDLRRAPLPIEDKRHAIIHVAKQCGSRNGRQEIVSELQTLLAGSNSNLQVHSYGACQPNRDASTIAQFNQRSNVPGQKYGVKVDYFSAYKFCVVRGQGLFRGAQFSGTQKLPACSDEVDPVNTAGCVFASSLNCLRLQAAAELQVLCLSASKTCRACNWCDRQVVTAVFSHSVNAVLCLTYTCIAAATAAAAAAVVH